MPRSVDELEWLLAEARAECERWVEEAAFWCGEGQEDNPLMAEWAKLLQKKNRTKADDERMGEIARAERVQAEDNPALRDRVKRLEAQVVGLGGVVR